MQISDVVYTSLLIIAAVSAVVGCVFLEEKQKEKKVKRQALIEALPVFPITVNEQSLLKIVLRKYLDGTNASTYLCTSLAALSWTKLRSIESLLIKIGNTLEFRGTDGLTLDFYLYRKGIPLYKNYKEQTQRRILWLKKLINQKTID